MEQSKTASSPIGPDRLPEPGNRPDILVGASRPARDVLAPALDRLLRRVPIKLDLTAGSRFPLLDSVCRADRLQGTDIGRQLTLIGAVIHPDADERWVAEYLLRHRSDVWSRRRTAQQVVMAARCAAAMRVRHVREREVPSGVGPESFEDLWCVEKSNGPSIAEIVVRFAERAVCRRLMPLARGAIADAVCVVLELSERHVLQGGTGPSVIAMRTRVKPQARLAFRLRREMPQAAANAVARTLVGPDRSPIETSMLWWVAHQAAPATAPAEIRTRWMRDLRAAELALASDTYPHPRVD